MNKNKITRFLQSFIAIPLFAATLPMSGVVTNGNAVPRYNTVMEAYVITAQEAEIRKERAEAIDTFFESIDSPLVGYGEKFVEEAEKNDLDWRLLPAITTRESTAYRSSCKSAKGKNNGFGYGGCTIAFSSVDHAIETVARNISGNNPNGRYYHDQMTTEQILKRYNPDSIVKGYSKQVIKIMKMIDDSEEIV